MTEFERLHYQRILSEAYRMSNLYVPLAIKKLDKMIEALLYLEPTTTEELHIAASAVIEEFANDRPSTT